MRLIASLYRKNVLFIVRNYLRARWELKQFTATQTALRFTDICRLSGACSLRHRIVSIVESRLYMYVCIQLRCMCISLSGTAGIATAHI